MRPHQLEDHGVSKEGVENLSASLASYSSDDSSIYDWMSGTDTTIYEDETAVFFEDDLENDYTIENVLQEENNVHAEDMTPHLEPQRFESLKVETAFDKVPGLNFQPSTQPMMPAKNRLEGELLKMMDPGARRELQYLGIRVNEVLVKPCDVALAKDSRLGRWRCHPSLLRRSYAHT